jgi:hypothetical protein
MYPSVNLSAHLSVRLFDYSSSWLSVCALFSWMPKHSSVCLSMYPSIHISLHLSVCLTVHLSDSPSMYCSLECLSIYPSVRLSIHHSINFSICLSICLLKCLSVCLSDGLDGACILSISFEIQTTDLKNGKKYTKATPLSVSALFISKSIYLSVSVPICLSLNLSIKLYHCPFSQSVCLSLFVYIC